MAEADPLRKYVEAGIAFTQMTRARAEAIVRDLVKRGDVQREQTQDRVEELLDWSRKSTETLVDTVRGEIAQQLSAMGFATHQDLERLEARLRALEEAGRAAPAGSAAEATAAAPPAAKAPAAKATKKAATTKAAKKAAPPPGTAARTAGAGRSAKKAAGPPAGAS